MFDSDVLAEHRPTIEHTLSINSAGYQRRFECRNTCHLNALFKSVLFLVLWRDINADSGEYHSTGLECCACSRPTRLILLCPAMFISGEVARDKRFLFLDRWLKSDLSIRQHEHVVRWNP